MGVKEFSVASYHISYRTGCIMEAPLSVLPDYFEPWNRLSKSISDLIEENRVRDEVHKLPLLDHTKLEGYRQRRLAHLQLSFITAGYVWQEGDKGVVEVLPQSVAFPFYHISKELGIHPVLCYSDLVLSNVRLVDPNGNFDVLYSLPGGDEWKWFTLMSILSELEFAKCMKSLEKTVSLIEESHCKKGNVWQSHSLQDITEHLNDICRCIQDMRAPMSKMHDGLSAATFFNVIRPFFGGWGGEGNILPEGLIYEGVSEKPMQMKGGSNTQSTSIQALDALFGIRFSGEKKTFMIKMREYMPPDHVRFIEDLENRSHLTSYASEMGVPSLTKAYNKCIKAMADFRARHIGLVSKYVISPAMNENERQFESLDAIGTGGTGLKEFLKEILHTTRDKLIEESNERMKTQNISGWEGYNLSSWMLGLSVIGMFLFAIGRKSNA